MKVTTLATTFTNNGTAAGNKQQLSFTTYASTIPGLNHGSVVALLSAAECKWSGVTKVIGNTQWADALIAQGVTISDGSGGSTTFNVSQMKQLIFADSGGPTLPTSATADGCVLRCVFNQAFDGNGPTVIEAAVDYDSIRAITGTYDIGNITAIA